ncbi:MAG: hypothetical protein MUE46_05380 [Xanthomonadales bacterium]|jgi:hypothetical protein|nr:hypothetical protein [Xanthomonadales bacterium]
MPALACSDLPNICQQQAQHFSHMVDIAATPPWGSEERTESGSGSSGSSYSGTGSRWTQEDWAAHLARQAALEEAEHLRRIETDPGYRDFYVGWWVPQAEGVLAKGGPCVLHFARKGMGVLLLGPARDQTTGFLAFYGGQLPRPRRVRTVRMTLMQDEEPAQTLQVFSSRAPWQQDQLGMVYFAVPDIEAALQGMSDEMRFELSDPQTREFLMSIRWHSGHQQREQMRACLAGRHAQSG